MSTNPPLAGDEYRSKLYPGQTCRVIAVIEDRIMFQWLGEYAYVSQQTATVAQFLIDFEFVKAAPKG